MTSMGMSTQKVCGDGKGQHVPERVLHLGGAGEEHAQSSTKNVPSPHSLRRKTRKKTAHPHQ